MPLHYFSLAESPRKRPETPPKPKKVGISQIASVVAEVYGSRLVAGPGVEQPTIPLQQKLLICTFLLMTKERNTKEVVLGKVGFEFQVSFFHMLTNRTGISRCLSVNMSINTCSCMAVICFTGNTNRNKLYSPMMIMCAYTAFLQILSGYII